MFGFLQTDGHLHKGVGNKGKLTLELSERDKHILYDFQKLIPCYSSVSKRVRSTNYKKEYISYVLSISNLSFRSIINALGIPYGKKSKNQKAPQTPHSEIDYIRGIIDANGSLGLTSQDLPFISLTTFSDSISDYFKRFIENQIGIKKRTKRNKRDDIYNISLFKEDATKIIKLLYTGKCLCLERKAHSAKRALSWTRPSHCRAKTRLTPWTEEEDTFIKTHGINESIDFLKRTKSSIQMRLWRLNKN